MKQNIKTIALVLSLFMASVSFAQLTEPGDGNGPDDTGINGEGVGGGGAPIGSGLALIIGMGVAYGGRKTWQLTQNNND